MEWFLFLTNVCAPHPTVPALQSQQVILRGRGHGLGRASFERKQVLEVAQLQTRNISEPRTVESFPSRPPCPQAAGRSQGTSVGPTLLTSFCICSLCAAS